MNEWRMVLCEAGIVSKRDSALIDWTLYRNEDGSHYWYNSTYGFDWNNPVPLEEAESRIALMMDRLELWKSSK